MDNQQQLNCAKCGRAKEAKRVGSITQWISVCACDIETPVFEEYSIEVICSICNKRISENKSGRITQWLFKDNFCNCNQPEPLVEDSKKTKLLYKSAKGELVTEEELSDDVEIPVNENFPKDRYKPLEELGTGAAGTVYLCRDKLLKKLVALKMLHMLTPDQLIAFQLEAKSTSRLNHPNIIEVLDFGATDDGAPFMVIEWFEGVSLRSHLTNSGALTPTQAIQIFAKVADALAYAHSQSIFHRDLKPSNILVSFHADNNLEVRLIDFGVAYVKKETLEPTLFQGKTLAGTPAYMSPDLGLGYTFDERSEIYSLGCTMFEALAGEQPYTGETQMEVLSMHATAEIPDIKLEDESVQSKSLIKTVHRCMAKSPDDRFQSMADLANQLKESLAIPTSTEKQLLASPENQTLAKPKAKKRRVKLTTWLLPILVFGLVCLFYSSKNRQPENHNQGKKIETSERFNMIPKGVPISRVTKKSKGPVFTKTVHNGRIEFKPQFLELTNQDVLSLLEEPNIYGLDLSNSYINGENLDLFVDKNLKVLKLRYCPITEKGFKAIGKITSLERLSIRDSKATGNVHYLSNLKNLRSLDMSNSDITDKDLVNLKDLPLLHSLNLAYSDSFTGEGLKLFKNHSKFITFKFQYSGIKEKYLREIDWNIYPELNTLLLDGCRNVSKETIAYLKKKYPRLVLIKDYSIEDGLNVLKNPKSRLK